MTVQKRTRHRTTQMGRLPVLSLILAVLSSTQSTICAFTSTPPNIPHPQISTTLLAASTQQVASTPKRRFAQPKFDGTPNNAKVEKKKQPSTYGSDSKLMSLHTQRVKTAGRKGTKRFVDPCKVFVGNLPYDINSEQMTAFILNTMGQSKLILHSSKVIVDWKTGHSKGFGFVEFTDPIFATVCMDVCNGKMLGGRAISVNQGKKKDQENELYINKKKKKKNFEGDDEDSVIADALEEAESDNEEYEAEELDVDEDGIAIFGDNNDEDIELDARLFGLAADDEDDYDDDDGIDGIFLEQKSKYHLDMDPNLNREQRREAARRIKKKKLPSKGFG